MTIKEKILKIMSLALEINPPEIKNIGKKRTAVFVNWMPHCNTIDLTIFKNGWKRENNDKEYKCVYSFLIPWLAFVVLLYYILPLFLSFEKILNRL